MAQANNAATYVVLKRALAHSALGELQTPTYAERFDALLEQERRAGFDKGFQQGAAIAHRVPRKPLRPLCSTSSAKTAPTVRSTLVPWASGWLPSPQTEPTLHTGSTDKGGQA